jgi:hypothetical protein
MIDGQLPGWMDGITDLLMKGWLMGGFLDICRTGWRAEWMHGWLDWLSLPGWLSG